MMKFKKVLRYSVLGILIILAMCGIPLGTFLPVRKEMDEDPEIKTEIVEGSEQKD
jgi:hypothetical protein